MVGVWSCNVDKIDPVIGNHFFIRAIPFGCMISICKLSGFFFRSACYSIEFHIFHLVDGFRHFAGDTACTEDGKA